jgi:hypothetical protein
MPRNMRQRKSHHPVHIATQNNFEPRQGFQGTQIRLLPTRLQWVVWAWHDVRREILHVLDTVFREQQPAQPTRIEPAVRSTAQGSEVKIETIDINVSQHLHSLPYLNEAPQKQKPPFGGFCGLGAKSQGDQGLCGPQEDCPRRESASQRDSQPIFPDRTNVRFRSKTRHLQRERRWTKTANERRLCDLLR